MRSLMTLSSILMVAAGIFCIANASVAFASVAFVVGLVFIIVGAAELLIAKKTSINEDRGDVDVTIGGLMLVMLGVAIVAGAVSEDLAITALFALIIAREGFIDIVDVAEKRIEITENSIEENLYLLLGVLEAILGVYMLFNKMTLNIHTLLLIGIALIFMGFRRFKLAFDIQYSRPGYLTGAQERLADAERDDKRAMAKAKEGIKESKDAQRRIRKIKEEMLRERKMVADSNLKSSNEDAKK